MGVKQFSPVPGAKSGKPSLPNSFTVTPPGDGTKSTGNAPELPQGSVGGNAAQKFDPTKNHAAKQTFVSTDIPSRVVGEQSKIPGDVKSYNVLP